jgi:Fe-S cluster assembly iron-binding protein IscA
MLAITPTAIQAIQGLTSQPGVPDGAGLKISGHMTPEGTAIELSLVETPEESDQVLEAEDTKVFVAAPLAPVLDDKILDAGVVEDGIEFKLVQQDANGSL